MLKSPCLGFSLALGGRGTYLRAPATLHIHVVAVAVSEAVLLVTHRAGVRREKEEEEDSPKVTYVRRAQCRKKTSR